MVGRLVARGGRHQMIALPAEDVEDYFGIAI
jgi:hypothetical protein